MQSPPTPLQEEVSWLPGGLESSGGQPVDIIVTLVHPSQPELTIFMVQSSTED